MSPLAGGLRGGGGVLRRHLVLERTLGVSDVSLRDILRCQLLHSLIVVVDLALLVVLRGESILLVAMDVFSLDDLPDVEELNGVVYSILDLRVILPYLFHVDLKHRYQLLRNVQLVLNSRQDGVLQDDVLDGIEVDWRFLADLVLVHVGRQQLLVDKDGVEGEAPRLDLDLPQVEDRGQIRKVPELGQALLLLLFCYVLLQEQEEVAEELPAVERDLRVVFQSLCPLQLVLVHVLGQDLRWLADPRSLVGRLGELLNDLRLWFLCKIYRIKEMRF